MASPFTLFEVSWEVCNKVGGIHTVVSTKAKTAVERFGDDYLAVGPWLLADTHREVPFDEDESFSGFCESCRQMGLPVRVGRWRIPGRPRTILVEFSRLYDEKDAVLSGLWEDFGIDSLSGTWDYVEPVLFGHAVGRVVERWWDEFLVGRHRRAVVHAHEWMTASSLMYLAKNAPAVGRVFTTHATMLGRALSSAGQSPDDGLGDQTPEELAEAHNVVAKHSLEGIAARTADAFTTVSEITAREAELLHRRAPDPILPNGIDLEVVDRLAGPTGRDEARTLLADMASHFFGEDVSDAAFLCVSGRYEFHNKGIDVLLDAALKMNAGSGRRVVLFVLVPAGNSGVRSEYLERRERPLEQIDGPLGISTHNLFEEEHDPVHQHLAKAGFSNSPDARVKIVQVPIYLGEDDGFLNLPYEAVLRAMDLSCFPSYYEPWGYTPQESLALGVPTVTTDYAGFGRWARSSGFGPEHGITVVPRVHVEYGAVVDELVSVIEGHLAREVDAEAVARTCRATAARTAWSDLVANYESAWSAAMANVQERLEQGVQQARRPRLALPVQPRPEGQRPRLLPFDVAATLPPELVGLNRLARNYWWSWDPEATQLFEELAPMSWEAAGHNPVSFLKRVYPEDLADRAVDAAYVARVGRVTARMDAYLDEPPEEGLWRHSWPRAAKGHGISAERPVAYFCAEFGVHESMRVYSGGLGILAGDHLKSASDLNLPLVAVGMFYRFGYLRQRLSSTGEQIAVDLENDPVNLPLEQVLGTDGKPLEISLRLPSRELFLRAWKVSVGRVSLYLLDANTPSNRAEDRDITKNLYGGDQETRLQQEIILGRGGVRLLRSLGIDPAVYHMNEGHAAFLTLERVGELVRKEGLTFEEAREVVSSTSLFTTHTPVPAGHDRFGEDLMRRYFSDAPEWVGVPWERFWALGHAEGGDGDFNMTYLATHFASRLNGVSELHGTASRGLLQPLWPGLLESEVPVRAVTNGIHLPTWTSPEVSTVLGAAERPVRPEDFGRELTETELARVWDARKHLKRRLIERARITLRRGFLERNDSPLLLNRTLDGLDEKALLIGFARRFAPYKRARLVFQDVERLRALLDDKERPVRLVVAGKAHPRDDAGKDLLRGIVELTRSEEFAGRVFFVEDYDMDLARCLVQGVDVWLNTPTRMQEASGTSGMKAAANGGLNLSIGDGWWPEADDGQNGWTIADARVYADQELQNQLDAGALYSLLEEEVVPLFFERDGAGTPHGWLSRVARCLATIPPVFNTDRMVAEYLTEAYGPLGANAGPIQERKQGVKQAVQERQRIRRGFDGIRIVSAQVADLGNLRVGDSVDLRVEVDLGELAPEDVVVELVVGHSKTAADLERPSAVRLKRVEDGEGTHVFEGTHRAERSGAFAYGIRVRPAADPSSPLGDLVLWA